MVTVQNKHGSDSSRGKCWHWVTDQELYLMHIDRVSPVTLCQISRAIGVFAHRIRYEWKSRGHA